MQLVVKHTFLEFVDDCDPAVTQPRTRLLTDSAVVASDTTSIPGSCTSDLVESGQDSCDGYEGSHPQSASPHLLFTEYPSPSPSPWRRPARWVHDGNASMDVCGLHMPPLNLPRLDDAAHAGCYWPDALDPAMDGYHYTGSGPSPFLAPWEHLGHNDSPHETFVAQQAEWQSHSYALGDEAVRQECFDDDPAASRTTVMLRDLPASLTRGGLLELLDAEGFDGAYDFVYLPFNFSSGVGLGYALVNLVTPVDARRCVRNFQGFTAWPMVGGSTCTVRWSEPHQGLLQHVERYRSSPVMHASVPDEWKPIVLQNGVRVPFPPPTKAIKAPKIRKK
mmetsp:Transcript_81230/g.226132  ORF Transcript_81230/g.226132 Transcript_81230/m.226132 type:complete len:334 (-) Transcript_81230:160-1161(-)